MKSHQINFRISEETYRLLKKYADAYDIDATTYAKICCIDIANGSWLLNANCISSEEGKSTRQINFRLNEEIYHKIREAAEETDMSITQFARLCCIQTAYNVTIPTCTIRTNRKKICSC